MRLFSLVIATVISFKTFAQTCPTNAADLADGGTFGGGNCTVNIDGTITISGTVNWTGGGTLTINDSGSGNGNGDVTVTGTINVLAGTMQVDDGFLTINSGANVTVSSGANLDVPGDTRDLIVTGTLTNAGTVSIGDNVTVDGTVINSGTFNSGDNIDVNGNFTNSGTTYATDDMIITGTYSNSGTTTANDQMEVTGTGDFSGSGPLTVNDDLSVDGSFSSSGTVSITDNLDITGTFSVSNDLSADDVSISGGGDFSMTGGALDIVDDLTVDGSGSTFEISGSTNMDVDRITVSDGADLEVGSGTTVSMTNHLTIEDASVTIDGSVETEGDHDIQMEGSSTLTVNSPADVQFDDITFDNNGASTVTMNGGNLTLDDDVNFNGSDDGDAIVVNGGNLTAGDNLNANGSDGSITVNPGGTVNASRVNGDQPSDPSELPSNINVSGGNFTVNSVSLPVELLYFRATNLESQVRLEWATATEIDNKGFYVEQSENGLDFEVIGFVAGYGDSKELVEYLFVLPSGSQGYFRLKQVDFDGDHEYSPIIRVSDPNSTKISIYPNPVYDEVRLVGDQTTIHQIAFYSMSGKKLLEIEGTLAQLETEINQVISTQPKGTYVLKIRSEDRQYSISLIKE